MYEVHHIRKLSKKDRIKFLDRALIAVAIIAPLGTIAQIIKIFANQDATSVSLISWGTYATLNIPWIIYGLVHKNFQITLAYIMWFIANSTVVVGILLYS